MLRKIIVSNCASENFFELLEKENIDYIKSLNNEKFNKNYNDHPDLSILKIDKNIFFIMKNLPQKKFLKNLN